MNKRDEDFKKEIAEFPLVEVNSVEDAFDHLSEWVARALGMPHGRLFGERPRGLPVGEEAGDE